MTSFLLGPPCGVTVKPWLGLSLCPSEFTFHQQELMNPPSRVGGHQVGGLTTGTHWRSDGCLEWMFFKSLCEFAGLQSLSCLSSLRNIPNNTFKGFLLCAWVYAHTVQGFVCVHDVLSVFLQNLPILPFESWSHTGTWASTIRLGWLSSESPGSACLCLPSIWFQFHTTKSGFLDGYLGSNSDPHASGQVFYPQSHFPSPADSHIFKCSKPLGVLLTCLFCFPTKYIQLSKLKIVRI